MMVVDELVRKTLEWIERRRALPESTYRVQLHRGFTFDDAREIVPYLRELGVTHLYASPYLKAAPGSTHGYDVIDHGAINPELGGDAGYERLLEALRANGMSHVLDTVPNHVGVATNENAWWNDVLEKGPGSAYAHYFDISWRGSPRPELHDRVLLPVLGGPYAQVLEKGELRLRAEGGRLYVYYYDRRFPISPDTYPAALLTDGGALAGLNGTAGDARSFDRLDELLCKQHYRLAYWRVAPDEINYRRFFDINDLAALGMEHEDVFEAAHALVYARLARGDIGGLRIDHPDGLYDPKRYFERLQGHYVLAVAREVFASDEAFKGEDWGAVEAELRARVEREIPAGGAGPRRWPLYVTVEKILAVGEPLPEDWPVHGTSGYDFLNEANGLFVDGGNEGAFTRIYQGFLSGTNPEGSHPERSEGSREAEDRSWTRDPSEYLRMTGLGGETTSGKAAFEDLVYRKKRLILERSLASELQMLARRLAEIARKDRRWRDFTHSGLKDALREVIACFPVYRSYVSERGVSERDRADVEAAVRHAVERNPKTEPSVFAFIRDALLQVYPEHFTADDRAEQLAFAGKFQQLTAPATAKGIEDTAFYIYNRLVTLNEVGGDPARFGVTPDGLHGYLKDRQGKWPYALSALSTHDTKRSEDVRARLNASSEMPEEWAAEVARWREINARHRREAAGGAAPSANDEYLVYQTLVGAWPLEPYGEEEFAAFVGRVQAYMTKAMREAKVHTSWTDPDSAYEEGVTAFVAGILSDAQFVEASAAFRRRVTRAGLFNSLSQTLLRLTAPGVPDTYQGSELWDVSLVDPDNRRPVDYGRRREVLERLKARHAADPAGLARELVASPEDGAVKLFVTWRALQARREWPGLFSQGEYRAVEVTGARAANVFAFERRLGGQRAIVVLPRLVSGWVGESGALSLAEAEWGDMRLGVEAGVWRNVFTGDVTEGVEVGRVLGAFPVGLVVSGVQ